ncbi:galactose mutarotase-like domain-containing protein [Favolaschia claudopus]|uniref:Galactose mutarotase-like domain-containing protein n=1 Tax=Favolaschia claudopus TaxID=2862362 RepID=A0AAW0DVP7_9AGAR
MLPSRLVSAALLLAGSALGNGLNAPSEEVINRDVHVFKITTEMDSPHQVVNEAVNSTANGQCPGYSLHSLSQNKNGLTAKLNLAGPACNVFGTDVANLTIQVTYETETRLHVNIFDTANSQFTVPESVFARPKASGSTNAKNSDLVFNYDANPFAFWITRRSAPHSTPLFDTRISSLPPTPIAPVIPSDNSTALDGFPLIFENQYLQLASALPLGANIYGLGEVVASSGIRRDIGTDGGVGTIQNDWARDIADPVNENIYGVHPIYMEHRFNSTTSTSQSHGVFLLNPAGADIMLLTPPGSNVSLIEYRLIGGTLDFYFLAGPTPQSVIEQYSAIVGTPTWQPYWGFGFHLCRWGYPNLATVKDVVARMRAADIPLETMWNDIDLYHAFRDFTADPVSFAPDEMREWIWITRSLLAVVASLNKILCFPKKEISKYEGAASPQSHPRQSRSRDAHPPTIYLFGALPQREYFYLLFTY